jgi:hypothetical protein
MEKPLTRDHVPPKLLLAKPYPKDLPTVPSCADCNRSFQANDEYTRAIAAIDMRAAANKDAQSKLPAIMRSLQRSDAAGFARYLSNQTHATLVLGANGIPIGSTTEADRERINATGIRLIKALLFLETGRRLSEQDKIGIAAKAGVTPNEPAILQFARVYRLCSHHCSRDFGSGFSYAAGLHANFSIWLMILYDYFCWAGTVQYPSRSPEYGIKSS